MGEYIDTRGNYHPMALRKTVTLTPIHPNVPQHDVVNNLQRVFRRAHPNIVPILDAVHGDTADLLNVFTPFCDHGTLLDIQMHPSLSGGVLYNILADVCEGLNHLNTQMQMLHGDIKPNNIFVRSGDHGPVGLVGDVDDAFLRSACDPQQHAVAGTMCYGAPFRHCDPRRDQVALVMVIAEAVSGVGWYKYICDDHGSSSPSVELSDIGYAVDRATGNVLWDPGQTSLPFVTLWSP